MTRDGEKKDLLLRLDEKTDADLRYIREANTPHTTSMMDMASLTSVIKASIRLVARIVRKDRKAEGWVLRVDDPASKPINIGGINAAYCTDDDLIDELWGRLCPDMGPQVWRDYVKAGGTIKDV